MLIILNVILFSLLFYSPVNTIHVILDIVLVLLLIIVFENFKKLFKYEVALEIISVAVCINWLMGHCLAIPTTGSYLH